MQQVTIIGLIAATCTTLAFIPQVIHILKTGSVEGISLMMYSVFTTGVACWLAYGLLLGDLPMILANTITLILAIIVISLTLLKRYGKTASTVPAKSGLTK